MDQLVDPDFVDLSHEISASVVLKYHIQVTTFLLDPLRVLVLEGHPNDIDSFLIDLMELQYCMTQEMFVLLPL